MKTKISQQDIPSGWQEKNLGDISDLYQPQTISKEQMSPDGKYLVFGANGIIGKYEKFNHKDPEVIVTCRGASCGSVSMTPKYAWITGNAMVIKVDEDEIIKKYIYYYLNNSDLNSVISGGAQPQITRQPISAYKILLPPLKEQQKIAEILGAVDEDIAKTQELIEATEKLKRGLMQELFTRGDKKEIREIAELNPQQTNPLNEPSKEFYYIDIASIKENVITEVKKFFGKDAPSRARRILNNKDIIVSTVRPNLRGFTYISEKYDNYLGSTGFCILRSNNNKVNSKFLYYIIANNNFTDYLIAKTTGSNYPAVNPKDIGEYICRVPSLDEQQQIADILSSIDEKIAINKKLKEKLILLKKGLMQDLLSGRVRVNIQ